MAQSVVVDTKRDSFLPSPGYLHLKQKMFMNKARAQRQVEKLSSSIKILASREERS